MTKLNSNYAGRLYGGEYGPTPAPGGRVGGGTNNLISTNQISGLNIGGSSRIEAVEITQHRVEVTGGVNLSENQQFLDQFNSRLESLINHRGLVQN
jgi:hypothetical protein